MKHHRFKIYAALLIAIAAGDRSLVSTSTAFADDNELAARVFQAGAAKSNVTPPLGLPIVGGWGTS